MKTDYYNCSCKSLEHLICFTRWDETDDVLYMNIHLSHYPFHKRIVKAIKYIFGYSCRYGHFDEFLIDRATAKNIMKMLNIFVKEKK